MKMFEVSSKSKQSVSLCSAFEIVRKHVPSRWTTCATSNNPYDDDDDNNTHFFSASQFQLAIQRGIMRSVISESA